MGLDVYTSVITILIVGWLGGLISQLLRVPRIVCMIVFGIALYPVIHPSVLHTALTVQTPAGVLRIPDAQNPSSFIRTIALLIALARGGLSVKSAYFGVIGVTMVVFATVPYACEMIAQGLVAPLILPAEAGFGEGTPQLVVFAAASVWSPLSIAIVLPTMLGFVESGLPAAGQLGLVGAPLEAATALLTEGILENYLNAINANQDSNDVLYFLPVYILGSFIYGLTFACGFLFYTKLRTTTVCTKSVGRMDPYEPLLVFLSLFVLCYASSNEDVNVPRLIGFFAAFSYAVGVQYLVPEVGDALCLQLKPIWLFAECFLFVLTGSVIRPSLDHGHTQVLFGRFFAVLLVGQLGRMVGDCLTAFIWQVTVLRKPPWEWSLRKWRDYLGRVAFCWVSTMPKATLQATLAPKMAKTFRAGNYDAAAAFIAPSAAIAILYMSTIGSLLTFSAGAVLARHFQNLEPKTAAEMEMERLCAGMTPTVTTRRLSLPSAHHRGIVPGNERVGPVVNLLTGLVAESDGFVAQREVTLDLSSPSGYMTGVAYHAAGSRSLEAASPPRLYDGSAPRFGRSTPDSSNQRKSKSDLLIPRRITPDAPPRLEPMSQRTTLDSPLTKRDRIVSDQSELLRVGT